MKSLIKTLIASGLVFISATATFAGPGAQYFSRHIRTAKDAATVTDHDEVAMACSKCKTIVVYEPIASQKVFMRNEKHACPGCKGEMIVKMTGSDPANPTMTHSCSKCGDESAFCCAMSSAGGATPGMGK